MGRYDLLHAFRESSLWQPGILREKRDREVDPHYRYTFPGVFRGVFFSLIPFIFRHNISICHSTFLVVWAAGKTAPTFWPKIDTVQKAACSRMISFLFFCMAAARTSSHFCQNFSAQKTCSSSCDTTSAAVCAPLPPLPAHLMQVLSFCGDRVRCGCLIVGIK